MDGRAKHGGTDASGNPILEDIGVFLRDTFKRRFPGMDVKYIDPSCELGGRLELGGWAGGVGAGPPCGQRWVGGGGGEGGMEEQLDS